MEQHAQTARHRFSVIADPIDAPSPYDNTLMASDASPSDHAATTALQLDGDAAVCCSWHVRSANPRLITEKITDFRQKAELAAQVATVLCSPMTADAGPLLAPSDSTLLSSPSPAVVAYQINLVDANDPDAPVQPQPSLSRCPCLVLRAMQ
jgi:hypothetical protein